MAIEWTCYAFADMSAELLYEVMKVRQEVFVVEQDCPYLDADGKDLKGDHLVGRIKGRIGAYLRILPPGVSYEGYASLGRILTADFARGSGMGKALMTEGLKRAEERYPQVPIKISGQAYLERFYQHFGFETVYGPYDEDGIPHLAMVRLKS